MAAHRLGKLVASALVFLAVGRAAVATAPLLRHYVVAVLNDPKDLPALETDPRAPRAERDGADRERSAAGCHLRTLSSLTHQTQRLEAK